MQIVQDVFSENYKTLLREIKEDLDTPYSWIRKLHTVKVSIPLKLIYTVNATPIKIPEDCIETDMLALNFLIYMQST